MAFIERARAIIGEKQVLTGADMAGYSIDILKKYHSAPLCVLRPGSTAEVAALVRLAAETGTNIVPMGGNTGLTGAVQTEGGAVLSLGRMNRVLDVRATSRVAIVEAGATIAAIHAATQSLGLNFPLTFGAQGSATIGGALATNAGGSNVLRYGNTRALCLGVEVVLPSGEVMDLMSELHKDNSGYDLRDLFIGAEGTLGIITRAVLKLVPMPAAYVTAMVAPASLEAALALLGRLQAATSGAVEAFEYMPRVFVEAHRALYPDAREPFEAPQEINIMLEVATADATPGPDGTLPLAGLIEALLGEAMERGEVLDAVIAQNEAQRREMWARREAAAEVTIGQGYHIQNDIALPLDRLADFFAEAGARARAVDPGVTDTWVAHLGDGNVHYVTYPTDKDPARSEAITEAVEALVKSLGGSFSAEHGIGIYKLASMRRHKDPVALATMRAIKAALDPQNIMNPGKTLP